MVRAREASTVKYIRFLTPLLALSLFFIPSIWLTTTLPPVAKAEKRAMRKFWIVLKQLTPLCYHHGICNSYGNCKESLDENRNVYVSKISS